MNCPDMERLIDFGLGQTVPSELSAHIQSCESCQADLRTIGALAGSSAEDREMSEEMISQIVASLPEPDTPSRLDWARGIQLCLTWGLGFVTAVVSVFGDGINRAGQSPNGPSFGRGVRWRLRTGQSSRGAGKGAGYRRALPPEPV